MRVKIVHKDFTNCPAYMKKQGWNSQTQVLVLPGKQYEVHAAAMLCGIQMLQVVNDSTWPDWIPAWLCEIEDPYLPEDWICTFLEEEPRVLMGPPFVAASALAYESMVDLEPQQQANFWERVRRLERRVKANRKLGDRVPAGAAGTVLEVFGGAPNSYLVEFKFADITLDVLTVAESDLEISEIYKRELLK